VLGAAGWSATDAEGRFKSDLVVLHVHSTRGDATPGRAIVDIFRIENGKVVEHWDVIQDVPTQPANDNGMF
jgi:predicted SnoaL-like aldol condensation-catalyzing enzyme